MEDISKEIKKFNLAIKELIEEDITSAVNSGLLQMEKRQLEKLFQVINLALESNIHKQIVQKTVKNIKNLDSKE